MDPFLKTELNRLDNMIFWLQNIKESPMFADKEQKKLKKENQSLKEIIDKFQSGEYSKEKLIQEYQILTNKDGKEN